MLRAVYFQIFFCLVPFVCGFDRYMHQALGGWVGRFVAAGRKERKRWIRGREFEVGRRRTWLIQLREREKKEMESRTRRKDGAGDRGDLRLRSLACRMSSPFLRANPESKNQRGAIDFTKISICRNM
jgi:hypothetical protein